jgi:hypothetical protein
MSTLIHYTLTGRLTDESTDVLNAEFDRLHDRTAALEDQTRTLQNKALMVTEFEAHLLDVLKDGRVYDKVRAIIEEEAEEKVDDAIRQLDLTELAGKVAEELDVDEITRSVQDNLDTSKIAEAVQEDIDYDEIAKDIMRDGLDYDEIASNLDGGVVARELDYAVVAERLLDEKTVKTAIEALKSQMRDEMQMEMRNFLGDLFQGLLERMTDMTVTLEPKERK